MNIYIPTAEEINLLDERGLAELEKTLKAQQLYLAKIEKNHQDANLIYYVPNKPNPRQKELLDAWLDPKYKVFTYTGGNRCLGAETKIFDPVKNKEMRIDSIKEDFHVLSFDGVGLRVAVANKPFIKERVENIYKISLSNGGNFTASGEHLILTPSGYHAISELQEGCAVFLPQTNSESYLLTLPLNALSSLSTGQDFQSYCLFSPYFYDGQPRLDQDTFRYVVPLQGDAQEYIFSEDHGQTDDSGHKPLYNRSCQGFFHPSTLDDQGRNVGRFFVSGYYTGDKTSSSSLPGFQLFPTQHYVSTFLPQPNLLVDRHQQFSYGTYISTPFPIITSIKQIRKDVKYDFCVPNYHNYYAGGAIHHNSGKTTSEIWLALSVLFGEYLWNGTKLKFPHTGARKIRIVGQDWEKHIKTVVEPAIDKWWPKKRRHDVKKNNQGIKAFWTDMETGSTLELMSNNQESDLFEGWDGDAVFYDEPPKRDIRVANARGLIDRKGRELFCMTLLKEAWIDREVIRSMLEDGRPDPTVFNVHATIWDNMGYGIDQEGIDQFAKTLTPDEKQARLYGKPAYMSGIVYPQFRREIHIKAVPRKGLPLDWITDIAIDFHPSKPWAVLFMTTDHRNFKYCIDEIWEHGSWKFIGEEIIRRIKNNNLRVANIVIDPLAKGDAQSDLAGESVFDKMSNLFMSYGYVLQTATKDKEGGIHMVQDLLMTENDMPALFFVEHLKRTIYEIEGYMYDENGKPAKVDDDMMENLYRLVLLGTQYYPPDEREEYFVPPPAYQQAGLFQNRNITGY